MKNEDDTLSCIGLAVVFVFIVVGAVIGHGLVLSVLWGWFIVPLFGLPSLTIWQALGVGLVVSAAAGAKQATTNSDKKSTATEAIGKAIGVVVVSPLSTLALGWLIHALAF